MMLKRSVKLPSGVFLYRFSLTLEREKRIMKYIQANIAE